MNYLVTGATGFVGRHLVAFLLSQGHSVNYLGRKRAAHMDSRAAYFCWDSGDQPSLECMGRLDAVINLAGEPIAQRWTPEIKKRIRDSRVLGTRNLVRAIGRLKNKPSVLISASGIGYYGDRGEEVLTEESGPGDDFLVDVCREWERAAEDVREFGVRAVPTRIAVVLGASGALKQMALPFRFGLGGRIGNGQQWISWIHIQDLVRLLHWTATSTELDTVVNAASPNPVRNLEFTAELARALHRPALLPVPPFVLRMAMGELSAHILGSARVLPEVAQRGGFQFSYPQLAEALHSALD